MNPPHPAPRYGELQKLLKNLGWLERFTPVPKERIQEIEARAWEEGYSLPEPYLAFLEEIGGGKVVAYNGQEEEWIEFLPEPQWFENRNLYHAYMDHSDFHVLRDLEPYQVGFCRIGSGLWDVFGLVLTIDGSADLITFGNTSYRYVKIEGRKPDFDAFAIDSIQRIHGLWNHETRRG